MLPQDRDKEIAELAEFIALEYSDGNKVDPYKICLRKEITYSCNDYSISFDGLLECKNGRFHIYCNNRISNSARIRFTFAHELGHYFIDEHRRALKSGRVPSHPSLTGYRSKKSC